MARAGKETQSENRVCVSVILFCQMGVWTAKKISESGYYCGVGTEQVEVQDSDATVPH